MEDKIIVTNRGALQKKYGTKGFASIIKALTELSGADKKRGIVTKIVFLDNVAYIKKTGGKAVTSASDQRENKEAIDAVFKYFNPHYLMILGATDIVPHQDLNNPAGDDDKYTLGDLSYACDVPYSQDPADFVGPTRVLGRLPDLVNASEPSYLLSLLKSSTNYKSRSPEDFIGYLGLSAEVWQGSTRLSLTYIFGNNSKLLLAPPSGPNYSKVQFGNRMHFINCHGSPASSEFFGQKGEGRNAKYPTSLSTKSIANQILEGTVASVECCYGAQLYDSVTLAIDLPICQSYMEQGAYGYFGSTTIAYGPEDQNAQADLICQYFLKNVLNGASIGRAVLMARQKFADQANQMDPVDLKTLAQFCLFGDPSVHPVKKQDATEIVRSVSAIEAERFMRDERRQKMKISGDFLTANKPTASKEIPPGKMSPSSRTALSNIAKRAGLPKNQKFRTFVVKVGAAQKAGTKKLTGTPSRYHITIGTPEGIDTEKVKRGVAVVAKEFNGRIIDYRIYYQR